MTIENQDLIPLSDAIAEIGAKSGGDNLPSMSAIYGKANTGHFPCIRKGRWRFVRRSDLPLIAKVLLGNGNSVSTAFSA
ncbi:hypothetical protein NBRC3280_2265 [Acetobacter pasteurianus NBRC 3280]|uniref:Uncharacterized protein n=1 Tax=Acetobacter pasteurianus NBRC 3278 TaxID=1226660 RepID=A0A401X6H5_ACEPA|nr:hypothetical protein [Acetobacter pasteurianus]GCD59748.1 hypothetical protein NBRC3277_2323 [Acetobacter pasteurianus NBRC 3277]GCD63259.1 hypothetical protein NBRC3278_2352 [Acetobacter pasteurianus NBRC 3278]GCD69630.1 hypothetical protein NBRC3280_2265 [Acetobacter pasteurianus NBRC 3280]